MNKEQAKTLASAAGGEFWQQAVGPGVGEDGTDWLVMVYGKNHHLWLDDTGWGLLSSCGEGIYLYGGDWKRQHAA